MNLCAKYFLILFISLPMGLYSQVVFQGTVVNGENNQPVSRASIFLNNTSIGSSANEFGKFSFTISRPGNYEVVVSSVGFEPLVFNLQVNNSKFAKRLIKMKPASNILDEVIVEAKPGAGWRKWGKIFEDAFIGTGRNASSCKILNKKDIYFEYDEKQRKLRAFARKPIMIENKALGYTINYLLQDFYVDYRHKTQFYAGYPHFIKIEQGKKFNQRRSKAYAYSLMHFIRTLYQGNTADEGFELRRIVKLPNPEKLRVKLAYKQQSDHPKDSVKYYQKVMKQQDSLPYLSEQPVPADSVITTDQEGNTWFSSRNDLQVMNTNMKEDPLYRSQQAISRSNAQAMSILYFKSPKGVVIDENGAFFSPNDLLVSAYWAWTSRLENMVPLDYEAPNLHGPKKAKRL